ncbi:MAG TPA: hypothetical protein PKA37_16445 [Planctomycetota bacterium]|nr:hypothetical protein [Planctomycetota bacterium]
MTVATKFAAVVHDDGKQSWRYPEHSRKAPSMSRVLAHGQENLRSREQFRESHKCDVLTVTACA